MRIFRLIAPPLVLSSALLGACGEPHYDLGSLPNDAEAIVFLHRNDSPSEAAASFSLEADSGCIDLGTPLRVLLDGVPATDQTGGEAGICRANAAWDGILGTGEHEILLERGDFGRAVTFTTDGELGFCGFPNCRVVN